MITSDGIADYADENELPTDCTSPSLNSTLATVQYLYASGTILWPNFTECHPNCGVCTHFTSDTPYAIFNLIIIGVMLPIIGMCGLFGNGLSAFIYSRSAMRKSSTNLYLCVLGCSDNAVIFTALFLFSVDNIRRYSRSLSLIYGHLSPFIYPAGMLAQTCSVYFTLAAGTDCFVQACLPHRVKRCVSSRRFVKFTITFILLFCILYNVPHCFETVLLNCWSSQWNSSSIEVCPTPFRFHPTYTIVYYQYMYSIFLAVGPLLLLIILNTCIILASVVFKTAEGNAEDNVALILVVLLFICCNIVALLINIFEDRLGELLQWRINYIIDVSNLLVVFNSSFNFVIYYNFSGPFRTTFLQHFCSAREPKCEGGGNSTNDHHHPLNHDIAAAAELTPLAERPGVVSDPLNSRTCITHGPAKNNNHHHNPSVPI